MQFVETEIEGLWLIMPFVHKDERGSFVKPFRADEFEKRGLPNNFRESFYSESVESVVRGMHFQVPPHAHSKLVFATNGSVLDVVLDLRKKSKTFGHFLSFELSQENNYQLFIPEGLAHGFCSLSKQATLFYFTTAEHFAAADKGIKYNSFGFNWPVKNPILSPRDEAFSDYNNFESPF